ncbi:hypothetical protein C0J52_10167 [Blattella germanica]|nr:hypothetical protein C0J52_10167 [Blattella germanica]PSN54016.1 hypothetical protein C0J52_10167 [Blattella germanica]
MSILVSSCYLAALVSCIGALIIPEELPSILSLIYSNIPPIKKGTDSRIGVGFRLGPHADFQVLLELGPQTNTQPLGPDGDSKRRRQIQRLQRPSHTVSNTDVVGDTPGGKWLSSWKSGFVNPKYTKHEAEDMPEVVSNPLIGKENVASHLQQLYKKSQQATGRSNDNHSNQNQNDLPNQKDKTVAETGPIETSSVATPTTTIISNIVTIITGTPEEPVTDSS